MNLAKALNTAAKDKEAVKYEQFKAEQREIAMKNKAKKYIPNILDNDNYLQTPLSVHSWVRFLVRF